ncbi:DUF559 domain-containing protein [Aeromicrobium massiliense]|uniref:DUF559 domain-containing protein n=1 Tax=Aeromicrobium massiliense TaxID=1464554 RepID=UPI000306BE98|nr:DUF559 domain-containing protein [Aeromicrobium massiliense]
MDGPTSYRRALESGATVWELRTSWSRPYRGIVRPGWLDETGAATRVQDAVALMTGSDVLTGWAAAFAHGVAHVDGLDRSLRPLPVVVCSPGTGQHRVRPGLRPTRRALHQHEITRVGSVRVTTLARAAYDMALDAPDEQEALVAIDSCISTVRGASRTTRDRIEQVVSQHVKTRGIVRARSALALASPRAASPWESRTRHVAVRQAGIRDLLVNAPVFDTVGALAGVADLLVPSLGLVIESDGSGHREERTHAEDNHREEKLERLGLTVVRVSALDHRRSADLAARLRTAAAHARHRAAEARWTLTPPPWWETWEPGRRWG